MEGGMPITYRIDHDRHLVVAEGHGLVSADDLLRYQREAWSRSDVAGYDELVDMTDAGEFRDPARDSLRSLADLAARMDTQGATTRLAIVAPHDLAFGLGRMYEAYRGLQERSTKQVTVFRDREGAVRWLEGGGRPTPA
jgi:hypothetical protein